jgi:hypothetical protein
MVHVNGQVRPYPKLLDWLRYICAFLLYMYGSSKLLHLQFNLQSKLAHRPIGTLSGYELTWYYYGYSRVYASILGLTQVGGATLLLFRKSTLLGAVLMTPVMANILLVNMFVLVNDYGPYFTSTLILISMLIILWHERTALVQAVWASQTAEPEDGQRKHRSIRIFILMLVTGILTSGFLTQHYLRGR